MWYFWKGIYEVEILVLVIPYCMEGIGEESNPENCM